MWEQTSEERANQGIGNKNNKVRSKAAKETLATGRLTLVVNSGVLGMFKR